MNCRHGDFQSPALPTELPRRERKIGYIAKSFAFGKVFLSQKKTGLCVRDFLHGQERAERAGLCAWRRSDKRRGKCCCFDRTKHDMATAKDRKEAFVQARSYALRMQAIVLTIAARQGLWIFQKRIESFSEDHFVFKACENLGIRMFAMRFPC